MASKKRTAQAYPNVQYPQNSTQNSGAKNPANPIITGPTLDDHVAHPYQQEIKHPKPPAIPTDDANGFRPSLPPDQKPKTDRSNMLSVDEPRMRQRKLKNLRLDRVDLVTAGANQGAHVTLFKAEQPVDVEKRDYSDESRQDMAGSGQALPDGSFPIKTVQDLKNAIQSVGRAKNRATAVAHIKQRAKALGASDLIPDTFKSMDLSGVDMSDELEAEEVEKQEQPEPRRVRQISKAQEKLEKALKDEQSVRKALEERLEKMENDRLEAEFIAKARELPNLGGASELGHMLLTVKKSVDVETFQSLERLLKAANAQLEKGDLFATLGRADAENPTAMDRINELAKQKLANGLAKTIELAKMEVIRENPDLRDEYLRS